MPCGTMQAAGSSYSYIREALCQEEERHAEETGESVYELLNQLVCQSPPGAKGLIFLPYLLGERSPRWNPDTSGSFLGIRMEHQKCDYVRAVLEGIAMNLDVILKAQREHIDCLLYTSRCSRKSSERKEEEGSLFRWRLPFFEKGRLWEILVRK